MKTLFYLCLVVGALTVRQSENLQDAVMLVVKTIAHNTQNAFTGKSSAEIRSIDAEDYEDVIALSGRIVVVTFWDEFSPESKTKTRVIEKAVKELPSNVLMCKIGISKNHVLASSLSVSETPVVKIYFRGEMMREFIGDINTEDLVKSIQYYVEANGPNTDRGSIEPLKKDWMPSGVHEVKPGGGHYTPLDL